MAFYDRPDLAYLEVVDSLFQEALHQQGSKLMPFVVPVQVVGESLSKVQMYVGEAHDRKAKGELAEQTPVEYDKRRITPRAFSVNITLDTIEQTRQGLPDPGLIAKQAADACGKKIDEYIIQGLGGGSFSYGKGDYINLSGGKELRGKATQADVAVWLKSYDKTQTIAWNDDTLCSAPNGKNIYLLAGLNAGKVQKAVRKIREKFANGPIFCVGSAYAMSILANDEMMKNTLYNVQPAFATGQVNPVTGVSGFISSEVCGKGFSATAANGQHTKDTDGLLVEYAYVFAQEYINLGCSMPLTMKTGEDPTRYFNQIITYTGMYDCVRMFEESVVRIEVVRPDLSDKPTAAAFTNAI